jgi:hypothetical protein
MRGWIERKPRGQNVREDLPVYSSTRLAAAIPVISTMKAVAMLHSISPISMVPIPDVLPACRRTPVSACPSPTVFMPSPIAADPDITRGRAGWHGLYDRHRHWCRFTHRRWRHEDRSWKRHSWNWKRDSKVDSEVHSGVYSGESHNRQSQNCDSLFHNYQIRRSGRAKHHYKGITVL